MPYPKLSLPTVSAPAELRSSLRRALDGYASKKLVSDGRVLYRHLVSRKTLSRVQESRRRRGLLRILPVNLWSDKQTHSSKETAESVLRYGSRETVSYAASRLHAVYGSTLRVLNEIAVRDPTFRPETMLDFGSGLGTAVWAAHKLWRDSLFEIQTVDTSKEMGEMAHRLRTEGNDEEEEEGGACEAIPGVYFRQYLPASNMVQYDVVTACYTLGDLPSQNIKKLSLTALWKKTKKYLVMIELGNSAGFENILDAREMVLDAPNWTSSTYGDTSTHNEDSLEGHVFAPCPHSHTCPLAADGSRRSCQFGQRVALDYSNKETLKHKGHSIESFSYVILKKGRRMDSDEQYSRILQPVKKRSKHVITQQCSPDGLVRHLIYTKSKHRSMYRYARESGWGDMVPFSHDVEDDISSPDTTDVETLP